MDGEHRKVLCKLYSSQWGMYMGRVGKGVQKVPFNKYSQEQEWEISEINGKVAIRSVGGGYLSARSDGSVSLVSNLDAWERWKMIPTSNEYFF